MSLFEKEYASPNGEESPELSAHPFDPPYHDYSATYRPLDERSRRKVFVWVVGATLATLVAAVGVAAFFYVGA